tara:strand:+ start:50 stop:553 length:504 start_codon:yes stop_codon:yes gene_type:complete
MILAIEKFRNFLYLFIACIFLYSCFFTFLDKTYADSKISVNDQKNEIKRSLESLRDLDDQTWQIIVYPSYKDSKKLILRIVGYPGSLRFDHPTDLIVNSGIRSWNLIDITRNSKNNIEILNDSAAEFDISPLIYELNKNRPLRIKLPGLINELPIPPYLVAEWRSLT